MSKPYLEITYRQGKPFAAYLYLPRHQGDKVARSASHGELVVDFTEDGRTIGVEITGFSDDTAAHLRRLLAKLNIVGVAPTELLPLEAA
ncbi:MAG: DUF2283 domain-containing protein [Tepidisphaeraceae bacterium]